MQFEDNSNTHSTTGKFYTVVSDMREWDGGIVAWSFFYPASGLDNLEDAVQYGTPSILVMTSKHFSGEDVSHLDWKKA